MAMRPDHGRERAAHDEDTAMLVDRTVSSQDSAAFAELYDRFVDRIYAYMQLRTDSNSEAEDLTECVFLKALHEMARYHVENLPFVVWLYRLAHTTYTEGLRGQRSPALLNENAHSKDACSDPAGAEMAPTTIEAELLPYSVRGLPSEQQEVIILKFMGGLETGHIALIMGKDERAIRVLLMRSLQSLHSVLRSRAE